MFVYRSSSSSVSNCFMQHLNQRSELMATTLIAGGSLSGLLHAVFLRREGHDVDDTAAQYRYGQAMSRDREDFLYAHMWIDGRKI
jgi:monoamine oxidase